CKTGETAAAAALEPESSTPAVASVVSEVTNFAVAAAASGGSDNVVTVEDATVDYDLRNAAAALQESGLCDETRDCPIPVVVSTTDELTGQQAELDEAAAALREAGFGHTDGDGNCFFSALSDQLQGTALEMNADNLRQALAIQLENWIDSAENDTGISEAEWRDLLEKTKRKGEYVSDHVASAAARLLGIEIYVYQDMDAGSNLDGIYLGPVGVEPRATVRLHFNRQAEHYQSVHVRQSSRLAAVDDGAAKMMPPPPPPPPAIPMQSVAQKVQEWKEVKCNRRACKRVPGATDVDNKFSIRVDENRFNVLWNVDLDAEEEEPNLSVCSGDDSTSKVSSSVSRRSRRNRSVPSCPTRRSSRLSAKACSSSNASVLSSAETPDSFASSVVRRRKRFVKPGSPTRRSERLLAKKRRMEEGDDASSVGALNLSSIGAATESDKVSCIAREEEFKLASVVLEESNDYQRPAKTKSQQRGEQNGQSKSRSSPRKKARNRRQA
uniref:OTU domain-containing protein n=1 Tax=Macrostomum lignano TaxID=282301 RepID=A0A1I8H232_9PLAT